MKKYLIWLIITLLLAACAPAQKSSPDLEPALSAVLESESTADMKPTSAPTDKAEPTETAVAEQTPADEMDSAESIKADALPDEAVLIFQRSGGYAGLDQKWFIYADGRIELPDGSKKQVDSDQVLVLLDTIQAAKFFEMNESYVPLDSCCDQFTYSITFQIDGQNKTVNTIDNAPKQPEQLTAVMEAIDKLLFATE